jgi:hypothetical protein
MPDFPLKKSLMSEFNMEAGWFSQYIDGLQAGLSGFVSRQGQDILVYSTVSRPALAPYPASYPVGIEVSFLGSRAAGA